MSIAQLRLDHGLAFPYDASDAWWSADGTAPPPPTDWAHHAARGVLADLGDRRGIKNELEGIDEGIRVELVLALAEIIRTAHAQPVPNTERRV